MTSARDFLGTLPSELRLPFTLLTSYLFFLARRPISESNRHYLERRLSGLRSLASLLQEATQPELVEVARELRALTPANFSQRVRALQLHLLALSQIPLEIPNDYVRSALSPAPEFLSEVNRVLLVMGPAIGIGDEVICFPIPLWLKQWRPNLRVDVLTAYEELWNHVNGVDSWQQYREHSHLLKAIRGSGDGGDADLVLLVDFEKPRLGIAMCHEPTRKYVELSIGANSAVAVDNVRRWMYSMPAPEEAVPNYYLGLRRMMRWLGGPGRPAPAVPGELIRRSSVSAGAFRIFVSPFTSKSDPSASYWRRLLAGIVAAHQQNAMTIVLDAGPNEDTERFASLLARSLAMECSSRAAISVARSAGSRRLSLRDAIREIQSASVVVCADSYCAHVAPLSGAETIVIANPGLERWRVPFRLSFYFDVQRPVAETVAAIRLLLDSMWSRMETELATRWTSDSAVRLSRATDRLRANLSARQGEPCEYRTAYEAFLTEYRGFLAEIDQRSDIAALSRDFDYLRSWRAPEDAPLDGFRRDFLDHLDQELAAWENSNLGKLLAMSARRTGAAEAG